MRYSWILVSTGIFFILTGCAFIDGTGPDENDRSHDYVYSSYNDPYANWYSSTTISSSSIAIPENKSKRVTATLVSFQFLDTDGYDTPEGNYRAEFIFVRSAFGKTENKSFLTYVGEFTSKSKQTINKQASITINEFNAYTDHIYVDLWTTEHDLFNNDQGRGSKEFYLTDWNGTEKIVDAYGQGARSQISVRFSSS